MKLGETAIRNSLRSQLKFLRDESLEKMGEHPMLFTEIGIPYDMDDKYAYKTGDYSSQIRAMDANHFALEGSGTNGFNIWQYMTEVRRISRQEFHLLIPSQNSHQWGDQWNGEDLSIFSKDDLEIPMSDSGIGPRASLDRNSPSFSESQGAGDAGKVDRSNIRNVVKSPEIAPQASRKSSDLQNKPGFRAAEAFIRPSAIYTAGDLLKFDFDLQNCVFTLSLRAPAPAAQEAPTEIYLPECHFPKSQVTVYVTDGRWSIDTDQERSSTVQRLRWWHGQGQQDIKVQGVKNKAFELLGIAEDESYLEQCQKSSCSVM